MNSKGISILCISLISILLCQMPPSVKCANILGVFLTPSPSHIIVHMSVAKVLAENGHNVTVVVTQEPKVNHDSIRKIIIPPNEKYMKILEEEMQQISTKKNSMLSTMMKFFGSLSVIFDMQADVLKDERFTRLYDDPSEKFDLVLWGYFMNSFGFGVAAKFQVPLIISWMNAPVWMANTYIGNPKEVAYVPDYNIIMRPGERMNFFTRVKNLLFSSVFSIIEELLEWRMLSTYNELFPSHPSFPTYADMKKNVSLIFCNGHFSEGPIRPNVPAVIEIGGIQIKEKANPLPQDLATILNGNKKYGVILFSLGSNLKSSAIKPETIQVIFKVFSELKQTVICKWDDLDNIPIQASNIIYKKWLPQDDLLAHPNMKLFVTHGGRGGIAEAQYHGIPMVSIPFLADQHSNSAKMEQSGYGQQVDRLSLTAEVFKNAINEILYNPEYKIRIQKFSRLYRDRPYTARQSVAYWTDYVLRHHGASHMQSPLVHMNTIQSLNVDVIGFLLLIFYLFYKILKCVGTYTIKRLFKKSIKTKTQ